MKRLLCTLLASLGLAPALLAQTVANPAPVAEAFRIAAQIKGVKDTTCVLAHYYGSGQYYVDDTARVDGEGRMVFEGTKKLPGGLYLVVMPNKKYVELVLGDPHFSFVTDTADFIANMKVTGSPDNEAFYAYQQQLRAFNDEAKGIDTRRKLRQDAASTNAANEQLAELSKKAKAYRTTFMAQHANTFTVNLLRAADEPEVPPAPKLANGTIDSTFAYRYYKAHFWDGFDFSDDRLVRSPTLQRKLDRYLKELVVQVPDSLIKEADMLATRAKANKEVFSYTVWYITNQYEMPKVIGTDGVFVHMAEKYYLSGQMPVSDSSTLTNIRNKVKVLKPLLVGKPFPALSISDTLKRPINLAALKGDYTVMFFYDPECGHCREATPKLKIFADANKGKGISFVAVAVAKSPDLWRKFIREFRVYNWVNGFDFTSRIDFRNQFDVVTTPMVYILDRDRKIIARRLPPEQVEDFIQFHKRQRLAVARKPAPIKDAKASVKGK
ncbi:MAG: DUF5106 domain-containing protein [Bacteroidetes bacterium]|nr:DUF5106 domain-containing protein [Fibrella sp.]